MLSRFHGALNWHFNYTSVYTALAKVQTIPSPHAQTILSLVGNTLHFWAVLICFTIWPAGNMKPSWLGFSSRVRNQQAAELQAVLPGLPGLPPPGVGLFPQIFCLEWAGKCAGGFVVKETPEFGLTASASSVALLV